MSGVTLAPASIDAIARRVVELLIETPALVDAETLARQLGRSRSWVYDHAAELGAIPLGDGRKPRLAFDPHVAIERLRARGGTATEPRPTRHARTRRRGELLPVKEDAAR